MPRGTPGGRDRRLFLSGGSCAWRNLPGGTLVPQGSSGLALPPPTQSTGHFLLSSAFFFRLPSMVSLSCFHGVDRLCPMRPACRKPSCVAGSQSCCPSGFALTIEAVIASSIRRQAVKVALVQGYVQGKARS